MLGVFSIVAKNYLGLANALYKSLKSYNPDVEFIVFVADELDGMNAEVDFTLLESKETLPIDAALWNEMTFKYNLTEFCTSIKPHCFKYLFSKYNFEKIVYFDPDILIYNNISEIENKLDEYLILLTPHIAEMHEVYNGDVEEHFLFDTGMYNLGFLGLKRNPKTDLFLIWWENKLINRCYVDKSESLFTDQKWIDFIPCFFDHNELLISRNLGWNLAPWNYFERKIKMENNEFVVENRIGITYRSDKLIFAHFSGINYRALTKGEILHVNIMIATRFDDMRQLYTIYGESLKNANFIRFIDYKYTYDHFENNIMIKKIYRRLYRRLTELGVKYEHPFSVDNKSFFKSLKKKKLLVKESNELEKMSFSNKNGNVFGKQLLIINLATWFIKMLIGIDRYLILLRFLPRFSKFENQIHLFDKKYLNNNIKKSYR